MRLNNGAESEDKLLSTQRSALQIILRESVQIIGARSIGAVNENGERHPAMVGTPHEVFCIDGGRARQVSYGAGDRRPGDRRRSAWPAARLSPARRCSRFGGSSPRCATSFARARPIRACRFGARRDAIDELSVLFNEMLERITTLIRGMEDALDNVAHDLRTPLTRLQGVAERRRFSRMTPGSSAKALVTCLEESGRILAMLDILMDISEAETGTMRLDRSDRALGPLVSDVTSLYEEVAEDKQIEVTTEVEPGLTVPADPQAPAPGLDQPRRQRPQVHAGGRPGACRRASRPGRRRSRACASTSPTPASGSSAHDLPRIWERLYRGDESRTERGLGLGLEPGARHRRRARRVNGRAAARFRRCRPRSRSAPDARYRPAAPGLHYTVVMVMSRPE